MCSDKQLDIKGSRFFTVPISSCGIAPILSRTTNTDSPACMTFRFGKFNGRVYCVFEHSPAAKDLPDGTEFGWTYDLRDHQSDCVEIPSYSSNDTDLVSLTLKSTTGSQSMILLYVSTKSLGP